MQSTELTDDIKRIFHNSPMAAAAVGEGGKVLYRNPACEQLCSDIDLSCVKTGVSCELYSLCHSQNKVYKFSVSPVSDSISLVNITPAGFDDHVFEGMSATVRKTFEIITETLNDLSNSVSDEKALDMLDRIDGNMLSAYSELLVPDAVSHMRLAGDSPFIVSISGEFLKFMEQLSYVTAAETIYFGDFDKIKSGLTARMDTNALRLLMLEFIADCMDNYHVHGITPLLKRADKDTILLELSCGYLGNLEKKANSRAAVAEKKQCGYDPFKMLSEELEKRYGCRISLRCSNDVSTLSVEIPFKEGECTNAVNSSTVHYIVPNRFADVSLYCARYAMDHRYKLGKR